MVRAEGREHDLKTKKNINTVLTHFKDNEVVAAKMDVKLWLNQALIIDILTVSVKNDLSEWDSLPWVIQQVKLKAPCVKNILLCDRMWYLNTAFFYI